MTEHDALIQLKLLLEDGNVLDVLQKQKIAALVEQAHGNLEEE